jgi:hypothetical protein
MKFLRPFSILKDYPSIFWPWFILCIVFGQLGILCSILLSWVSGSLRAGIDSNLISGNFHTFAISLLGASFFPLFRRLVMREKIDFIDIRVVSHVLALFLFVAMVILVAHSGTNTSAHRANLLQVGLYFSGMVVAVYLFCLDYLSIDYESYKELDDSILKSLLDKAHSQGSDGRGVKL